MNKNMAKYLTLGMDKYFGTKKVLRGRTFHPDIRTMGLVLGVLELLRFQGWAELFLDTRLPVHEKEVREFYTNLNGLEGSVANSSVNGVDLVFDSVRLDEIFHIPYVGLSKYVWTKDVNCMLTSNFSQEQITARSRKVLKGEMSPVHKLLFELVQKGVLPRGGRRHEASLRDMGIAHALENKDPIDCPSLMIKHMAKVIDPKPGAHQLAFGNLFTTMFTTFDVPLGEGRALVSCDMITRSTLATCRLYDEGNQAPAAPPRVPGPVSTLLNDLHAAKEQNETLRAELEALRNL
ncbi:hypothetical protein AABB24_017288 [Solanum stoloniferum]|uniref:Putative plant transposon protein domain-containing protein n=1 Tax=Solanum stoloniferum TaxID=62892 RepID=A0ABD2TJT5_9SOLN